MWKALKQLTQFALVAAACTSILGFLYFYFSHQHPFDDSYAGLSPDLFDIVFVFVTLAGRGLLIGVVIWVVYKIILFGMTQ